MVSVYEHYHHGNGETEVDASEQVICEGYLYSWVFLESPVWLEYDFIVNQEKGEAEHGTETASDIEPLKSRLQGSDGREGVLTQLVFGPFVRVLVPCWPLENTSVT